MEATSAHPILLPGIDHLPCLQEIRSVKDKPFYCQSSVGTIPQCQGQAFLLPAFCKQSASLQQLLSQMAMACLSPNSIPVDMFSPESAECASARREVALPEFLAADARSELRVHSLDKIAVTTRSIFLAYTQEVRVFVYKLGTCVCDYFCAGGILDTTPEPSV